MSIAATHWAYNQLELSGIAKNILSNLAFRANNDLTCFPSVPRIARDVGCSERSVQKKIKELEQLGLVERIFRKYEKGGNRSNLYRIVGFADRPLLPPQKTEPAAQPISGCGSPSYSDKVHQAGEQSAHINKTQKNTLKKTTTAPPENSLIVEPIVVVIEEPVLPTQPITATALPDIMPDLTVLEVFDAKEKNIVVNELKKVTDLTAQAVILFTLKTMIANNTVEQSPIAVVCGLINKAINGVLVTKYAVAKMKQANEDAPPKLMSVEEKLRSIMEKHRDAVLKDLRERRFVYVNRYGNFYPSDFEKYGLIGEDEL